MCVNISVYFDENHPNAYYHQEDINEGDFLPQQGNNYFQINRGVTGVRNEIKRRGDGVDNRTVYPNSTIKVYSKNVLQIEGRYLY